MKSLIEVGIDVTDPINFYSNSDNILYTLRQKYEKKCYNGVYIVKILNIIKQSECIVNQERNDGSSTINIVFEAESLVYTPGDILTGCVVKHIDERSGMMACETNTAYVMIKGTNIFESVKVGQIISAVVGSTRYSIGSHKIAVNAYPYVPGRKYDVYKIVGDENVLGDQINAIKERVLEEERHLEQLKKSKTWQVFAKLTLPWETLPKVNTINLSDDAWKRQQFVTRNGIDPAQPLVRFTDKAEKYIELNVNEIELLLYREYYNYLKFVRELSEVYSTAQLIKSHNNLWAIYKSRKLAFVE